MTRFLLVAVLGLLLVPASQATSPDGWTLTLAPASSGLVVGEPLMMDLVASNTSGGALEGPDALAVRHGLLALFVAQADGPFRRFLGPGWGSRGVRPGAVMYAPGASVSETATVFWAPPISGLDGDFVQGAAFPEPGTYRLKAEWSGLDGSLLATSGEVRVTVTAAPGVDRAAKDAVLDDAVLARAVQNGYAREGTEAAEKLQEVQAQYPSSRLAASLQARTAPAGQRSQDTAAWATVQDDDALMFALHTGRLPEGEVTAQDLQRLISNHPGTEVARLAAKALEEGN